MLTPQNNTAEGGENPQHEQEGLGLGLTTPGARTYNVRLWHNVRKAQCLTIEAESLEDARVKALQAYRDFLAYVEAPYLERGETAYRWEEDNDDGDGLAFAQALDPVMSIEEDADEEGRFIQQPEGIDDVELPYPYYGRLLEFVKQIAAMGPDSGLAREARTVLAGAAE